MSGYQYRSNTTSQPPSFALDLKSKGFDDELVIVNHVDEVLPIVRSCIQHVRQNGIAVEEYVSANVYKIRLNELSILEQHVIGQHAISKSQRLLCSIFHDLLHNGWRLMASTNLRVEDKRCSLIFSRDPSLPQRMSEGPIVGVSLDSGDKIYLFNADDVVREVTQGVVARQWPHGYRVKEYNKEEFRFHLSGDPWRVSSMGEDLCSSRLVILNLIRGLSDVGLTLYASSHPGGFDIATDTLYFTRHSEPCPLGASFMLGLLQCDDLYLVDAPSPVCDLVRQCLMSHWDDRLVSENRIGAMLAFKLGGGAWSADSGRGMLARVLVVRLFEALRACGWCVSSTLDVTHRYEDASCFVVSECRPEARRFMALSFHGTDRMRVCGVSSDVSRALLQSVPGLGAGGFTEGMAASGREGSSYCEFKLQSRFSDNLDVLCDVLYRVRSAGWNLVSSADLSVESTGSTWLTSFPNDLHTWIFEEQNCEGAIGFASGTQN